MYQDIEKQLNVITSGLQETLRKVKAINDDKKVTNVAKFNKVLNHQISQCYELLSLTEKDGVTTDRYGADLIFARISWLEEIKNSQNINPYEPEFKEKTENISKTSAFQSGITKLIEMIHTKFNRTKTKEKNR